MLTATVQGHAKLELTQASRMIVFLHFLGTLQPPQEIIDLQMAMMEVLFKPKEGDRDQQINKLRIEADRRKQNIFKFDQQRFVSEEMDTDTYKRLKNHANEQIVTG